MRKDQIWVPENSEEIGSRLRLKIIKEIHDQPAVGHPGIERTIGMVQRSYYWPGMRDTVERYLRNCHVCKRAKAARDTYNGLLQPLPVPERPWVNLTMDFVVGLPKSHCQLNSKTYDAILMVIDRLLKEKHYIPCTETENGANSEHTAKMFLHYVWSKHGLPVSMTSDRGPQFVAEMWDSLCKLLGIMAKLSTAWHPETNGQSKITNQEMKRHLRSYVNHFQDDWVDLLPMAEFSSNANTSATTKIPPFLASRDYIPQMNFDPVDLQADNTCERLANAREKLLASKMEEVWNFTRAEMAKTQQAQAKAANLHRKPAPEY